MSFFFNLTAEALVDRILFFTGFFRHGYPAGAVCIFNCRAQNSLVETVCFSLPLDVKWLVVFLVLSSCAPAPKETLPDRKILTINDPYFQGQALFQRLTSRTGFKLSLLNAAGEKLDQAVFPYAPYHLDTADVNNDGRTDILVGLIKSTTFDPVEKKRLFILRIDNGQIRPLWLGSKVCQELVTFKTLEGGIVQTLEKTKAGKYAIGHYAWQSFGLILINYIHNEKSFEEALQLFSA